jgi:hypothetical protein
LVADFETDPGAPAEATAAPADLDCEDFTPGDGFDALFPESLSELFA